MYIQRNIFSEMLKWKANSKKKPLIVMGARQVGKTTVLLEFGKENYTNVAYFNLEKQQDIHEFFLQSKEPETLINNLSLVLGDRIDEEKTLIIFDEIQECRDALIALKYFQEDQSNYSIIAAGSLLGITLGNDRSFPVGKVEFLDMQPLSFSEFLLASDEKVHKSYLHFLGLKVLKPIPTAFFNPIMDRFKEYIALGGMPEVVESFLQSRDINNVQKIQEQILRSYSLDFVKHATNSTSTRIQYVWDSIPSQLAKENKKFLYKVIKSGARAREYEDAITWLIQAGLLIRVNRISKPGIPLKAYADLSAFKLYLFDTGLLLRLSELDPSSYIQSAKLFTEFKGAIAENYIAQCLKNLNQNPSYWESDGRAEIDYLIRHKNYAKQ